jgi:hypothetical protein
MQEWKPPARAANNPGRALVWMRQQARFAAPVLVEEEPSQQPFSRNRRMSSRALSGPRKPKIDISSKAS